MHQLPTQYRPLKVADFIGPARTEAETIESMVQLALQTGAPLCYLLLGPPGIGKSALSGFITHLLGGTKWTVQRFNGKEVGIEEMNELARQFRFTTMFDGFRIVQIEEVDKMTKDAQVRALTFFDDMPRHSCVIATSNCQLGDFEERFQRRFKLVELKPPGAGDIEALLLKLAVPPAAARQIATFACGNVGQALQDADTALAAHYRLAKAA